MADLSVDFCGIKSPNPFWLASAPPTNTGDQVMRAFDAGWGGAVWKTLGQPIVNVSSRYSSVDFGDQRMMGLNNIELITDRPLEVNFAEIAEVKRRYPKHALVVSLMVESNRQAWHDIVRRAEDAGADGLELNFGCPHGMSERGMGAAVGQVPEYTRQIVGWVKEVARTPVIVKLTPNITDITFPARAAEQGGADAVSLINTIKSITSIDLETLAPRPTVHGASAHGGYCGPAVKPIALAMVASVAKTVKLPISGIGGISNWRDAVEFILLGATTVQVCTAVMHHGFRIVLDMIDGLSAFLDSKGLGSLQELVGRSLPHYRRWEELDLGYRVVAHIDSKTCIGCGVCYAACNDGAHQAIAAKADERGRTAVEVLTEHCVGCNLCSLVCPVANCITMRRVDEPGRPPVPWVEYGKNPSLYPNIRSNRHD